MSDWPGLDRFLAADPRDVGCEQALAILHIYVEMVLEDAPGLAARRYPWRRRAFGGLRTVRRRLSGSARRGRSHPVTGDYPPALPPVNHTEPVPRRIRATLAGQTVLDTMSALYVWEWPHYPQYYIPLADIDPAVLVDEQHEQKLSRGTARRYSLQVGDVTRPAALRVYGDDAVAEGLAGHGAVRVGRPGRLVRGGRAGLRPPPQPVHPRRRAAVHPAASGSSSTASCWPNPARR